MKAQNGRDIYALIEKERAERRQDIGEIHNRIDEVLKAINKIGGMDNASWVRQSIGLTIAVIALIGFLVPTMVAIVRPMQQQISSLNRTAETMEFRAEKMAQVVDDKIQGEIHAVKVFAEAGLDRLDSKLQIELDSVIKAGGLEDERNRSRLEKLEEWQKWWHRNILTIRKIEDGQTNIH